jgi:hypothetical protein
VRQQPLRLSAGLQGAACSHQQLNLVPSFAQTQSSQQGLPLATTPTPLRINLQDTHLY